MTLPLTYAACPVSCRVFAIVVLLSCRCCYHGFLSGLHVCVQVHAKCFAIALPLLYHWFTIDLHLLLHCFTIDVSLIYLRFAMVWQWFAMALQPSCNWFTIVCHWLTSVYYWFAIDLPL